jgi:hypothetical protein
VAEATTEFQGKQVFKGGENSIVVYLIDQSTGEPFPRSAGRSEAVRCSRHSVN